MIQSKYSIVPTLFKYSKHVSFSCFSLSFAESICQCHTTWSNNQNLKIKLPFQTEKAPKHDLNMVQKKVYFLFSLLVSNFQPENSLKTLSFLLSWKLNLSQFQVELDG